MFTLLIYLAAIALYTCAFYENKKPSNLTEDTDTVDSEIDDSSSRGNLNFYSIKP